MNKKYKFSKESRLRMSIAAKKRIREGKGSSPFVKGHKLSVGSKNGFYNKNHSIETIKKLRKVDKGYTKTDNFRKKVSIATKNAYRKNYGDVLKCWTEKYGKKKAIKMWDDRNKNLSKKNSGKNNPMYGKKTPVGSGNGWSGWYKEWYFRSFLELSYMINVIEKQNLKWKNAECKELVIPYNFEGRQRTYRADFLLIDKNLLVDCKPKKLWNTKQNKIKKRYAIKFCKKNNLKFEFVEPKRLSDNEILELYKKNKIKLIDRYDKKFNNK